MIEVILTLLGAFFVLTVLAVVTVGAKAEKEFYPVPDFPKPPIPGEENKEEE